MTGFFENMLLHNEGLTDQDIADLNAILPDVQALDEVLQTQWSRITRVAKVALPIINKIIAKQRSLTS
jgi:hypothetical protein